MAELLKSLNVVATKGSFDLDLQAVNANITIRLIVNRGNYVVDGQNVQFSKTAFVPLATTTGLQIAFNDPQEIVVTENVTLFPPEYRHVIYLRNIDNDNTVYIKPERNKTVVISAQDKKITAYAA